MLHGMLTVSHNRGCKHGMQRWCNFQVPSLRASLHMSCFHVKTCLLLETH